MVDVRGVLPLLERSETHCATVPLNDPHLRVITGCQSVTLEASTDATSPELLWVVLTPLTGVVGVIRHACGYCGQTTYH